MFAMYFSSALCGVEYLLVGIFGYLAFRARTAADILTNLHMAKFWPAPYVKAGYSLVMFTSYPEAWLQGFCRSLFSHNERNVLKLLNEATVDSNNNLFEHLHAYSTCIREYLLV